MRIQKLDNTTFGYNKTLNQNLVKKLEKNDGTDERVKTAIKNLNTYCNQTEDMLNLCDSNSPAYGTLYGVLVSSKLSLAELVETEFPELDYLRQEIDGYKEEAENASKADENAKPWQAFLQSELEDLEKGLQVEQISQVLQAAIDNGVLQTVTTVSPQQEVLADEDKNEVDADASDLVEKFVPNEFSPKGFESLGGMASLKEELYDKIIFPATHPEEAKLDLAEYGKRAPRGIMLYGPPGCGKTSTVQALSQEAKLPLYMLKISNAGSPYINQTSNNYQEAFDYVAEQAKASGAPCFILIDEIDGISKGRGSDASSEDLKQMSTLLNLIETARDRNLIVIGATNKYDIIDDAIKRRFDSQVYVGMPDNETRQQVLEKTLNGWKKGQKLAQDKDAIAEIATKLDGFPTSAIVILADKASTIARKDGRRDIAKEDFFAEIEKNKNLKIKEKDYQPATERKSVGFGL